MLICLGGAIGTGLRYLTAVAAVRWFGPELPYGTLIVNLVGSFLIGFVQQMSVETVLVPEDARLFLSTGIMGGFTTYSAFSYETVRLVQVGAWLYAGLNVVVTTAACLALCALGMTLARSLLSARLT
ncbi:MAG TPA: fluoride efflux transporter CrcB [Methylomirabilota bacterium]